MQEQSSFNHGVQLDETLAHPYRPQPDPATGVMTIDPDIKLKAKKFDLEINFIYSTGAYSIETEFGRARSATTRAYVNSATSGSGKVTVVRGNFDEFGFSLVSTVGSVRHYVASPSGALSTLQWDGTQFVEFLPDGMRMSYSRQLGSGAKYELNKVADPDGVCQTYVYGSGVEAGLLKRVEVPGDRRVTFNYTTGSSTSLVSSIQDWTGRRWTMQYDANRNLVSYVTPTGCTTKYFYTNVGSSPAVSMVQAIEDPRGYRTSYTYDSRARVIVMTAGAAVWQWDYSSPSRTVMLWPTGVRTTYNFNTDYSAKSTEWPTGKISTFTVNSLGLKVKEVTQQGTIYSVAYGANNQISASDDPLGYRTTYLYDSYGNLTTMIDRIGAVWTYAYDGTGATRRRIRATDPLGRVNSWVYNAEGLLIAEVDGRGLRTTYAYVAQGFPFKRTASDGGVTTTLYDFAGRPRTLVDPLGNTTTLLYDNGDNLITKIDALGYYTTYIYDTCLLSAVVDAAGSRTTYTYNRYGQKTSLQPPSASLWTFLYDDLGFLIAHIRPDNARSTSTYNSARQLISTIDFAGARHTFSYDSTERMTSQTNPLGQTSTYIYNQRDPIATIYPNAARSTFVYDNRGYLRCIVNPLNERTTDTFDASGKLISTQDASGRRVSYSYYPNGILESLYTVGGVCFTNILDSQTNHVVNRLDPSGKVHTYSYTARGDLFTQEGPMGTITTYAYNATGKLLCIEIPTVAPITYSYDPRGLLTAQQQSEFIWSNTYDEDMRPISRIDAEGLATTIIWGDCNVPVAFMDPTGGLVSVSYDPNMRQTGYVDSEGVLFTWSYDLLGRIEEEVGRGISTTFAYDVVGNMVSAYRPASFPITFLYDLDSKCVGQLFGPGRTASISYNPMGMMAHVENPIGERVSYLYSESYPSALTSRLLPSGFTSTYSYGLSGEVLAETEGDTLPVSFSYNDAYERVFMADELGGTTYAYDDLGRLISSQTNGLLNGASCYDEVGRIKAYGVKDRLFTYTYLTFARESEVLDPLGDTTTLIQDAFGRTSTIVSPSGLIVSKDYDTRGKLLVQRVSTPSVSIVYTYVYDSNDCLIASQDSNGGCATYIYDSLARVAGYEFVRGAAQDRITYEYDMQGNLSKVVRNGLVTSMAYNQFGQVLLREQSEPSTYAYNTAGQLENIQVNSLLTTYSYGAKSRLKVVEYPSGDRVSFSHDGDGLLVSVTAEALTTFLYLGGRLLGRTIE